MTKKHQPKGTICHQTAKLTVAVLIDLALKIGVGEVHNQNAIIRFDVPLNDTKTRFVKGSKMMFNGAKISVKKYICGFIQRKMTSSGRMVGHCPV